MISLTPITSSSVAHLGYDAAEQRLTVVYHRAPGTTGTAAYTYEPVTQADYDSFFEPGASAGKLVNAISRRAQCTMLTEEQIAGLS